MRLLRRVVVSVGWAACTVLCGRIDAQASAAIETSHASPRTPISRETADGAAVYSTPESSAEGVLREMASRAAVIFSGTVTAVKKGTDGDQGGNTSGSIVEVDFAVDHTVQGTTAGAVYAMREWAGLWRDSPRFVVGQRLLMLLHAPGPGGLSSPVDGLDGAIPIKATASTENAPLTALAASADAAAEPEDAVDMRWLQAKTLRTMTVADAPVASPGENFAGGLNATPTPVTASSNATTTLNATTTSNATTMAEASTTSALSHVLGLLASWQETGNGTH